MSSFNFTFLCTLCGESSHDKDLLLEHLMVFHTVRFRLLCAGCSKKMKNKVVLKRHMMTHITTKNEHMDTTRQDVPVQESSPTLSHRDICHQIAVANGMQFIPVAGKYGIHVSLPLIQFGLRVVKFEIHVFPFLAH
jgi:hypothetical protein